MKWTYVLGQKMRVASAVVVFLLLLLLTHVIDRKNFSTLHESFTAVYKDRLLAETYIYDMAEEISAKRMALFENPYQQIKEKRTIANNRIKNLISDFRETTLTDEEASVFRAFVQQFETLDNMEQRFVAANDPSDGRSLDQMEQQYEKINDELSRLSKIQLKEGQKLMAASNTVMASSHLNSQTEVAILILAALVIQSLIFASRSSMPKIRQDSRLN
jgi:hypothetical protein